jgi:hypothetical protein
MSREAGMGMAGKTGDYGGTSSGNTGGGDGDNNREQYAAARTQTPRGTEVNTGDGGQTTIEDPYVIVGGQRYAVDDPKAKEAVNTIERQNLLQKTIDLYQQYSPLGMVTNLLEGLLGPTVPSTGNVGPAGIKTDGTYGTVEDAIRAGERNEPMVDSGGESERDMINRLIPYAPYAITDTTPQDSMVNQYFANLGMNNQPLSSSLQTDYNNAKININSLLGILPPPSQQFGYSTAPYGLLSSTNLEDNPFYIDYLQERGLI